MRAASSASKGGEPLASQPLPAQALLSLAILSGAEVEIELIGHWLRSPYWGGTAAGTRARHWRSCCASAGARA